MDPYTFIYSAYFPFFQATRIAYSKNNNDFRRVVTLDGAVFEKSGTMSGGGGKPRGGKMGTSIRASSVSTESIRNTEAELASLSDKLASLRGKIGNAAINYQSLQKAIATLEMELAKSQKEVFFVFLMNLHFMF